MTMSRRPFPLSPPHSSQYSSPSSSHSHSSEPPNSSTRSPPPPMSAGGELVAVTPAFPKNAAHKASFTPREDCWSEEATKTLIEAWGERYLELKRGNLRQNHWQEVAAAVNALHALTPKLRRTDIQCKNRMDTVKKKYKIEKSRVSKSSGHYLSPWPFFSRLDFLLAPSFKPSPPPSTVLTRRRTPLPLPPPPPLVPVGRRSKRLAPDPAVDSAAKRRFSAMVAAAAEEPEEEEESDRSSYGGRGHHHHHHCRHEEKGEGRAAEEGLRRLAEAIGRFGEIYERVEGEKQRQMVELEKQRMRFAKDLEIQRMKLFTDSQLQLERIHRATNTNIHHNNNNNNNPPLLHSPTSWTGFFVILVRKLIRRRGSCSAIDNYNYEIAYNPSLSNCLIRRAQTTAAYRLTNIWYTLMGDPGSDKPKDYTCCSAVGLFHATGTSNLASVLVATLLREVPDPGLYEE